MPTNVIADDFGPRALLKDDNKFHGDIDFNCSDGDGDKQKWNPCVSPQEGVIADFDKLTHGVSNYKYGLVNVRTSHTLLFGHVFDGSSQFYNEFNGSIILKRCVEFPLKWALLLDFKNSDDQPLRIAYGQVSGATLRIGTPPNHTDYITTNIVNTTDPLFPIGTSPNYTVHLHLNSLPYNTEITGS